MVECTKLDELMYSVFTSSCRLHYFYILDKSLVVHLEPKIYEDRMTALPGGMYSRGFCGTVVGTSDSACSEDFGGTNVPTRCISKENFMANSDFFFSNLEDTRLMEFYVLRLYTYMLGDQCSRAM